MAKNIVKVVRLILPAGKATPAYPVGPVLGGFGINLMSLVKDFNARTIELEGFKIPIDVTIYTDRSFSFQLHEPTASSLLRRFAGVDKGSADAIHKIVGSITREQLHQIAERKQSDLKMLTLEAAEKTIAGTARNMGITIAD